MYLIDDKHFVLANLWRDAGLLHESLDLLYTIIAGGIKLKDVEDELVQPLPGRCLCDLPLALASMSRARTRLSGWPACSTASAP